MTAGKTVIWDRGAIAAGGGNRKNRYIDILVASAAALGLIESVYVRNMQSGEVSGHSDGGVIAPVPLASFMTEESSAGLTHDWFITNEHVGVRAYVRGEASVTTNLATRGVT